jgi:nucleoside-diphosphate-sugar epimerase
MRRVLLTGATGFIGSNCLPLLLEAGYDVHAVVPEGTETGDARATWHTADLLEARQLHTLLTEVKPSHLLHLAWFVAPGEFWRSTENVRWLQSSLDLAREFADAGGERSVMAGTCAEYAQSNEPLVESVTPLRPTTLYGACKTALHVSSAALLSERGVSNAWGHIFYLYGPREHPSRLVPSVIQALTAGEVFVCQHPDDVRDFLHVEDVASAFVDLLGSEVDGAVNIASGQATRIGSIVDGVAAALGRTESSPCDSSTQAVSTIVGSASRLRDEVGWAPKWTLDEGLAETIAWWEHQQDRQQSL